MGESSVDGYHWQWWWCDNLYALSTDGPPEDNWEISLESISSMHHKPLNGTQDSVQKAI